MSSYLLTKTVAKRAVAMVKPWFEQLARDGVVKRHDLHIVIMDPTKSATGGLVPFQTAVLYEESWGDPKKWEHPYNRIARSKAEVSWSNLPVPQPTREIVFAQPWKLSEGDTRWWGSAVLDGIIVACSGVQPWYDEMIAAAIAAACRALVLPKMYEGIMKSDINFLGDSVEEEGIGAPETEGLAGLVGPDCPVQIEDLLAAGDEAGTPGDNVAIGPIEMVDGPGDVVINVLPDEATAEEVTEFFQPNADGTGSALGEDAKAGIKPRGAEEPSERVADLRDPGTRFGFASDDYEQSGGQPEEATPAPSGGKPVPSYKGSVVKPAGVPIVDRMGEGDGREGATMGKGGPKLPLPDPGAESGVLPSPLLEGDHQATPKRTIVLGPVTPVPPKPPGYQVPPSAGT